MKQDFSIYDFSQILEKLDISCLKQRMNKQKSWDVPFALQTKPKPNYLIGDILRIENLIQNPQQYIDKECILSGWCRTVRKQLNDTLIFVELNDGTCQKGVQIVVHSSIQNFEQLLKITKDFSLKAKGIVIKSLGKGQEIEVQVKDPENHYIQIIGECQNKYPLAKGHPSIEFLRDNAHLRTRSNLLSSVTRVRNNLAFATHIFFQSNGFQYINTPLITTSDCEGAGELFLVSTPIQKGKEEEKQQSLLDSQSNSFFKKQAYLTCSGQLNVETVCCSLSNVYTFGPAFRAEHANTIRHLAEFWMIEPELAFCDLIDDMDCAEAYIKFSLKYILDNNTSDLEYLSSFSKKDLKQYLQTLINEPFARITYSDAIEILKSAVSQGKIFENSPIWGDELYTEHEKFLAEIVFKKIVIVYNYPKIFKAFYMRLNDDKKTVASMDILAPQVGELIGGSQREERLEVLEQRMKELKLDSSQYQWYLDLRKFGTIPHAGFGLGFERFVMVATGIENIKDVIPFPRYYGKADF